MDVISKIQFQVQKYPQKFIDSIKEFELRNFWSFINKKFIAFVILAYIAGRLRQQQRAPEIPSDLIDWHDWEFINQELEREGIGEQGEPAFLTRYSFESEFINATHGFNGYLSDQIALNRALRDLRPRKCIEEKYNRELPKVSVIIVFHEEYLSTLLRTLYSVWLRSPVTLLNEVILIDDASTMTNLGDPLTEFLERHLPMVKLIRLKERTGLIKARMIGAEEASSEVLVFLDAHCEVYHNWLPPLLDAIRDDYQTVAIPTIDVISNDTFEYHHQGFVHRFAARGMLDLNFNFKALPLTNSVTQHPTKPFEVSIMSAGMFAINANYFWQIRAFDTGLEAYGGEQYDLSFKIWMCGGKLVQSMCSRVGHIYRARRVPVYEHLNYNFVTANFKRVAEVWMDEYKEHIYKWNPSLYSHLDVGDLSAQIALRERLQCKSFRWYLENVAFDWLAKIKSGHRDIKFD